MSGRSSCVWTCQVERHQVWPSIREFALVSDAQRLQILHQPMAKVHQKKLYHPTEEHKSCAEKPWKNPIEGRCLHWCLRAMLHFSYHSNYSYLLSGRLFICYALTTCLYNNSLNSCFVLVLLPESGKCLQHCCWRTLWPAPAYALLAESTYTWQAKHLKRESTTAPRWTKSWPFFRFQLQPLSEDGVCLCWCCPPCFCCSASICLLMCEACEEDLNPIPFA